MADNKLVSVIICIPIPISGEGKNWLHSMRLNYYYRASPEAITIIVVYFMAIECAVKFLSGGEWLS